MTLRLTCEADLEPLHDILLDPAVRKTYRAVPVHLDEQSFAQFIAADSMLCLTIETTRGGVVGFGKLYGYHSRDLTARVAVAVHPRVHNTGVAGRCVAELLESAFVDSPIRKLYVEASIAAFRSYRGLTREIITVEGTLKAHQWDGAGYEDVVIGSIFRENWIASTVRSRMLATGRLNRRS